MIKRRDFIHQNIKYSFNWNQSHFNEKARKILKNYEEIKRLESFFVKVLKGTIPNHIFNSKNLPRISQFKIKGLKSAFVRSFSKKLIRDGKIKKFEKNAKLVRLTQKVFENYERNNIHKNPGHNPILKNILIKDKNSIAIEVPIWKKMENYYITGHIDLLQIEDHKIKVIDYKPEGNFLISLPQVATYGLIIKSIFKIKNLYCVSFNKNEVWEYDPSILKFDIKKYLISQGIKERAWENFI
ncbi:MAG: hypothetical protein ACTSPD_13055 [Promethearchaeota archaeon]